MQSEAIVRVEGYDIVVRDGREWIDAETVASACGMKRLRSVKDLVENNVSRGLLRPNEVAQKFCQTPTGRPTIGYLLTERAVVKLCMRVNTPKAFAFADHVAEVFLEAKRQRAANDATPPPVAVVAGPRIGDNAVWRDQVDALMRGVAAARRCSLQRVHGHFRRTYGASSVYRIPSLQLIEVVTLAQKLTAGEGSIGAPSSKLLAAPVDARQMRLWN